jgi:two-component system NtrC family sensor kinase
MRLAVRFTLAIAGATLFAMAGHWYLQRRDESTLLQADRDQDMDLARALEVTVEEVWKRAGDDGVARLVESANRRASDVRIRYLALRDLASARRKPGLPFDLLARMARGEPASVVREDSPGNAREYTYVPIAIQGAPPAALEVSESTATHDTFVWRSRINLLLTTLLMVTVSGFAVTGVGMWFIGRPLRLLRERARAVSEGGQGVRLAIRQRDEIGELAAEFDAMCDRIVEERLRLATETEDRIATLEQLRHTDRLTTMGQLASGVAHELGTPLNVIAGRAKMLESECKGDDEAQHNARVILEQSSRMTAIIRQLLDFSRRQGPKLGIANLREIVGRTLDMVSGFADKHGVRFELDAGEGLLLGRVDQNQVQQALTNVIMNGIQSMPKGGTLRIALSPFHGRPPEDRRAEEGDFVCITVQDEGEGIARENLGQIFEPFFTTKGTGEGTGLGLSVAYGIVREHGGWIDVESEVGRGSRFRIYLARAAARDGASVGAAS